MLNFLTRAQLRYVLDNGEVAITVDAAWDIPKIRQYVEKKQLRPRHLHDLKISLFSVNLCTSLIRLGYRTYGVAIGCNRLHSGSL